MSKRDYYEVLGVTRTVTEVELKVAFRKKAMEHHPDKNPGDQTAEIRFKEVNEAYQVLSDGNKRALYDRHGHAAFEQGGGGGPGGFGTDFGSSMSDIFENIFGEVFGGQRRQSGGRERGADLRYNLEITLDEAFHGKAATIKVPTSLTCETCSGTGAKPGTKPKTCATCGGHGRVRATQGFFAVERTCPACHGRGETIDDPCRTCAGAGRVTKERTLSVNVPAGVEDGVRIRLSNEGEAGRRGGPSGDLYVFLAVKPHPLFQRDGADLFARVPITMVAAALGTEIAVPSLDGSEAKVKIPEGTQSGKQFRIKGRGMPILRTKDRGDLFIQCVVETPQNLTRRQKELLREFEQGSSKETQPEAAGFFARVKKDIFGQ